MVDWNEVLSRIDSQVERLGLKDSGSSEDKEKLEKVRNIKRRLESGKTGATVATIASLSEVLKMSIGDILEGGSSAFAEDRVCTTLGAVLASLRIQDHQRLTRLVEAALRDPSFDPSVPHAWEQYLARRHLMQFSPLPEHPETTPR